MLEPRINIFTGFQNLEKYSFQFDFNSILLLASIHFCAQTSHLQADELPLETTYLNLWMSNDQPQIC